MSTGPCVVFRADESSQVGFGHMSRCRALADARQQANAQVSFWRSQVRSVMRAALENSGVTVVDHLTEEAFVQQDWHDTVVVVDGYQFDEVFWQRLVFAWPQRTVCSDDFCGVPYLADIVVCNKEGVDGRQFQLPKNTRLFLGGRYLPLRPEILTAVRLAGRPAPRRALMVVAGVTYQAQWVASTLVHMAHVASDCRLWVLSGRRLPAGKVLHRSGVRRSQVRFFSGLDASAMIRRYRQARCLVTSASTVILEAFAIGCPDSLAQARLKPDSVKIGCFSAGTQVNLLGLQEATGAKFLLVPFRSNADAIASTMGGFIDAHVYKVATAVAQAGKLTALSFGGRTATIEVPETLCHDIDNLVDWESAEIKHEHRVAKAGNP